LPFCLRPAILARNGIGFDPDHDNNLKRSRNRERQRLDYIHRGFFVAGDARANPKDICKRIKTSSLNAKRSMSGTK
jgi:hypothetical protein